MFPRILKSVQKLGKIIFIVFGMQKSIKKWQIMRIIPVLYSCYLINFKILKFLLSLYIISLNFKLLEWKPMAYLMVASRIEFGKLEKIKKINLKIVEELY